MGRQVGFFQLIVLFGAGVLALSGCSQDDPVAGDGLIVSASTRGEGVAEFVKEALDPPDGRVDVTWAGVTVTFWPYTGEQFDGHPSDPINLVFAGEVDPVQIRAALFALDGDRTAFGFPDAFPFNATWSDALGNVQTGYADDGGWTGGVVQLQLGSYEAVRFHLRLFETGAAFGPQGGWTVANAHLDVTIPGTADHQVICWELAEAIVAADLVRSGLLGSAPSATGVINEEPSFRDIPAVIFNGLPDDLKIACGLPTGTATEPVPIPNDGVATILDVAGSAPVETETRAESFAVEFNQVIPMPFCSGGPMDFILVNGPLELNKTVRVAETGRYEYQSRISGHLVATPVDVSQQPPVPVGESFRAIISDVQNGFLHTANARVTFDRKRIALQDEGTEKEMTRLKVSTHGESSYRAKVQCLEDGQ